MVLTTHSSLEADPAAMTGPEGRNDGLIQLMNELYIWADTVDAATSTVVVRRVENFIVD
jgi:hypothetical protein